MGSVWFVVGRSCAEANGVIQAQESKWAQIKIQEDPLFGARIAITKFCSAPFCVASGAAGPCHFLRATSLPCADLVARARACASKEGSVGPGEVLGRWAGCSDRL